MDKIITVLERNLEGGADNDRDVRKYVLPLVKASKFS